VGVVPEEWETSTIGDEFHIQLGKMLDTENNVGVSKPFLGNRSVQWGEIDVANLGVIKLTNADIERFRLREGDLLVCEGGEVGRAAIWEKQLDECYYQKALHRLRAKRGYDVQLAKNLLHRYATTGALSDFVTQTSIAHLPKDKFERLPIPVPPQVEQRAIAAALGDVDALLGALDAAIAKQRDLKQATMQQLLTGQTRLPGFAGEWETKCLGDLAVFLKGKGLPKSALLPFGRHPCIHYGELFTKYAEEIRLIISSTDEARDCVRSSANDVLMPTSDVTPRGLAKASCVIMSGVILGGDILIIRPDAVRVYGTYLSHVIRREEEQVLQLVTGTTVFHLYGSDMKKFCFALPPIKEQNAIVTVLSDMDSEIDSLASRRTKTAALKQAMMQSLLTGRIRLV